MSAPERAAVRVLVLGQAGVGKSSLVNAMAGETRAAVSTVPMDHAFIRHDLRHGNAEEITLIDSPALTGHEDAVAAEALTADAILWVVSATRPDRAIDAEQIARLRTLLSANIRRQPPPIILALTNIDRVRPFNEWQPPYNVAQPSTNKEHSIREALDAVTHDLAIDPDDVVPVMSASIDKAYNVDTLWAKLMEVLPEALNTQLARALDERTRSGLKWGSVWRQARNAGTTVGKAVWDSATSKRKIAGGHLSGLLDIGRFGGVRFGDQHDISHAQDGFAGMVRRFVPRAQRVDKHNMQIRRYEGKVIVAAVPENDVSFTFGLPDDAAIIGAGVDDVADRQMRFVFFALLHRTIGAVEFGEVFEALGRLQGEFAIGHRMADRDRAQTQRFEAPRDIASDLRFADARTHGADCDDRHFCLEHGPVRAEQCEIGASSKRDGCLVHHIGMFDVAVGEDDFIDLMRLADVGKVALIMDWYADWIA